MALQVQQRTQTLDVGRHGALGVMFDGISEVIRAAMRQSWTTEKEKQVWQYLADRMTMGSRWCTSASPALGDNAARDSCASLRLCKAAR